MINDNKCTHLINSLDTKKQKYGPLGELSPAQEPPGSGYFECNEVT